MVRSSLDACWPWLKAIRDDERRSLQILWSDDATMLKRRLPAIVAFLEHIPTMNDAVARGKDLAEALQAGRFVELQTAARLYATHRGNAERKFHGDLEKDMEDMRKEATGLSAVLKKLPDPGKVEGGGLD
jgi:pyruvate/2-oxoglutarate dehydrogenase complex dihydrolipoamide acyltransferase (E2) component